MVAWAGPGVAVANAHPAVIAVADEVDASNDEDGVAHVLERLVVSPVVGATGHSGAEHLSARSRP